MEYDAFERSFDPEPPPEQATGPLGCLFGFLLPLLLLTLLALGGTLARSVHFPPPPEEEAAPVRGASPGSQGEAAQPLGEGTSPLAPLFTPEVQYWAPQIARWVTQYQLDPNLIATVMQIESCGDPQATSTAGARGLFQVMPFHFAPNEDPYDPETNARRGLTYLRQALRRAQGDVTLALAMYNGGPGVLSMAVGFWPAETQRYIGWGAGIYADAQAERAQSPTLDRWLSAGGWSLCRRAHQRLGLP